KLHIDRRRGFVVILDLGFGERGLLHGRPHYGPEAAIKKAVVDELEKLPSDRRLGAKIHCGVGLVPLAHATEALELLALDANPVLSEIAAVLSHSIDGHFVLRLALGAVLL